MENNKSVRLGGLWAGKIEGPKGVTNIQQGKVVKSDLLAALATIPGDKVEFTVFDYSHNKKTEKSPEFALYIRPAFVPKQGQ